MKLFSQSSQGFHLFFTLAGIWSVMAMAGWLGIRTGVLPESPGPIPMVWLHGHEMVFGFTAAAAAGFLLTATPVWSKTPPLTGRPLFGLGIAWLLARSGAFFAGWLPALADLIFFCGLLFFLAPTLWFTGRKVHRIFPILLGMLALGDLLFHLETVSGSVHTARVGLLLGANAILFFLVMTGGHIMPMFTRDALRLMGEEVRFPVSPALEILSALTLTLLVLADLFLPDLEEAGWLFLVTGAIQGVRLFRWRGYKTLHIPLLWVLHLGYLWLVVGFLLRGIARLTGVVDDVSAQHALYVGAMGLFTLGVMSRISLTHTGRPLQTPTRLSAAFLAVVVAAMIRVFLPAWDPMLAVWLAGGLWIAAYGVFCSIFLPILTTPTACEGKS